MITAKETKANVANKRVFEPVFLNCFVNRGGGFFCLEERSAFKMFW